MSEKSDENAAKDSEKTAEKAPAPIVKKPVIDRNKIFDKNQNKGFMQSKGTKGAGAIRQMRSQRGR